MPDRTDPRDIASAGARPARRGGALAVCVALALGLHALFLDGVGSFAPGASESATAPMSVRTIAPEPEAEPEAPAVAAATVAVAPPAPRRRPRPPRRPREPTVAAETVAPAPEAGASSPDPETLSGEPMAAQAPASSAAETLPSTVAVAEEPASAPTALAEAAAASAASTPASAARPTLLGAGEQPPPVYRTQLPPSATLHYQVRRGFLRGDGEIRWQSSGDGYRLVLEARIAGLTLLLQSSEGGIDANGLAPVRFLDQRARRAAQAANFRRDAGKVTFSGTGVEWPLLDGSQDRLSWMIQLAAIAAAEPQLLAEGGRITMAVYGARGDASVWTLRYAGSEDVETARGTVRAVKLVREPRSAYDTGAEIWLDPERSYLPAHATLRNSSGASDYDLLLDRIELAP